MRHARWGLGVLCLYFGAISAVAAWTWTNCTQASADSLYGVIVTLPLYLVGWLTIPKRGNGMRLVFAVLLPAVITVYVTAWTISLASGDSACELITGLPFERDGREQTFAALWGVACIIFWLGAAVSIKLADWRGVASVEEQEADHEY